MSSSLSKIPYAVNHFTNPSFETSTTGFTGVDLGPDITGPTSIGGAWVGNAAIRFSFTDTGSYLVSATSIAAVEGDEINTAIAFRGAAGTSISLNYFYYDALDVNFDEGGFTDDYTFPDAEWHVYTFPTGIAPAGTAGFRMQIFPQGASAGAFTLDIDAVDVRINQRFDNYIDGDQGAGIYGWFGTAHASKSYRIEQNAQGIAVAAGGIVRVWSEVFASNALGQEFEELSDCVTDGDVVTDIDRDVKSTLSLVLSCPDAFEAYDWVKVYRTIFRESTGETVRRPLGVFQLSQPSLTWLDGTGKISGSDPTSLLGDISTTDTYNVAAGTNYITAVAALLTAAGLTGRFFFPADARTLPTGGKSWPSGTSYLKIINELLGMISYYSLYALPDGTLTSIPFVDRVAIEPHYVWTIGADTDLVGDVEELSNDDNIYNYVIVTKTDNAQVTTSRTAENLNTAHPFSTVALGAKAGLPKVYKTKKVEFNEAADAAALQAKADETLQRASMLRYANVSVMPLSDHSPHQVAQLNFDGSNAARLTGPYYIEYYSIPLMHEATNVKLRRVESTS